MSFSFGGDSKAGAGGGFSFGAVPAPTGAPAPASTGLTFGAPAPATARTASDTKASGFQIGGTSAANPAPVAANFSFGAPSPAAAPTPGFSLGGTAAATPAPAPATGSFSFGSPAAAAPVSKPAAPGGFSFGATATAESKPAAANATPTTGGGTTDVKPAGFSLGGTTAAPAMPSFGDPAANAEKKDATPAPAGGFSFSAPAATTAPTGGGFSFGAGSTAGQPSAAAPPTPAAGTPAFGAPAAAATAPPTPATPAPVQTPAKTSAPTPGTAAPEELQYKEMTVEQILNLFQRNLEIDSKTYLEEARVVLERDGILRDAQTDVANITQKLRSFYVIQSDMEDSLKAINGYQDEMERTLAQAEESIADLFDAQSHMQAGDADLQREVAYATAEEIERRLQAVSSTLEATSRGLDDSIDAKLSGDIRNVVKVLNQHTTSLESLDLAFDEMDKDITEVNQVLRG